MVLFGRGFNRYALKRKLRKVGDENCTAGSTTNPILLMALLLQSAFWARLEERFTNPFSNLGLFQGAGSVLSRPIHLKLSWKRHCIPLPQRGP